MAQPTPNPFARLIVNIGTTADDGTGDTLRSAFDKINNNFELLFGAAGITEDGIRFADLYDTPEYFVEHAFVMVNTSSNGVVYNTLDDTRGDITAVRPIIDGNLILNMKDVISSDHTFTGNINFLGETELPNVTVFVARNNAVVEGSLDVYQDMGVGGQMSVAQNANFAGSVLIEGDLQVLGNTIVQDTYINLQETYTDNRMLVTNTAPSTSTVTGALVVSGGAGIVGDVYIGGTLNATGATNLDGPTDINSSLSVNGPATFNSSLTLGGAMSLDGDLVVGDNKFIVYAANGNTVVQGQTLINNLLSVTGGATLSDTLTVNGAANLNSSLSVAGESNLHNTSVTGMLSVSEETSLEYTLTVDGATTLGSTLSVAGTTTLFDPLSVQDTATFSSNVTIGGTTVVNGHLTANNGLELNNTDITGVGAIEFNDPGANEGLYWRNGSGWRIFESPDNLVENVQGNLQFVVAGTRVVTMDPDGIVYVVGNMDSTSKTTGQLVVSGGIGVNKKVHAGSDVVTDTRVITTEGVFFANGNPYSVFNNFGSGASPTPPNIPQNSISGFNAYSSNDFPGNYYVGLTVKGDTVGGQLAMGWDADEGAPTNLYYRINDDTGNTGVWGAWRRIPTLADPVSVFTNDADYATNSAVALKFNSADFDSTFDTRLATKTTSNIAEGTNLYYTDARARAAISAGNGVVYNSTTGVFSVDTSSIPDITYTTNAINTAIGNLIASSPTTLDTLQELANAINNDASFASNIASSVATKLNTADFDSYFDTRLATKTTSNVAEGTNLYFTNARAISAISSAISAGNGISYSGGVITNTGVLSVGGSNTQIQYNSGGSLAGSNNLTFDGTNLVCGGDVTAFSDASIKSNVTTIANALSTVRKMRGVDFYRTDINEWGTGVIAQEAQPHKPELVKVGPNGKLTVAYGNYAGLFIESFKEVADYIDTLRQQVESLQEELRRLKGEQ